MTFHFFRKITRQNAENKQTFDLKKNLVKTLKINKLLIWLDKFRQNSLYYEKCIKLRADGADLVK